VLCCRMSHAACLTSRSPPHRSVPVPVPPCPLSSVPDLLPTVQVDRGAIKFVLKGADIMAPGLTSAGGDLSTDLPAESYVAIKAEGMTHILAIGKTTMSTADMKKINKGTAITNLHFLNDGLWNTASIE
jgi:PUA domain protein